jgi:hypothetical protein
MQTGQPAGTILGDIGDALPRRFAAAVERAERLAHENAALRAKLAARRLDRVQWTLVGVIALCGVAITCVLVTWR